MFLTTSGISNVFYVGLRPATFYYNIYFLKFNLDIIFLCFISWLVHKLHFLFIIGFTILFA